MLATCKVRMASRDAGVRASAARMMEAVADNLVQHTLDKGQSNVDFTSQHDDVIDPLPMLEEAIRWLGENLGEEFPDTLAAILSCMNALLCAIAKFSPDSSSDESSPSPALARLNQAWSSIFPRLVPILKNRNDAVLQYVLSVLSLLVSCTPAPRQELLRLAFDAVENLRSTLRPIRRAASACIGAIANTLGPHDVLAMLLANLRVQERSARVATTVALAAVAETCGAFTVLPALFTEYRTPELHVRTGVLKSMAFLAESLGPKIADYVDAMSTVVVDALTDRDLVHRQQACGVAKFLALGCVGKGKETVLLHILNHVWPNVLEQSPHVVEAVMGAVEGFALALGPGRIVQYTVQGLFHPARKVRDRFWTLWNLLLQGWADAMVASIPRIEAIESKWHVEELDLML
jgi:splicing factor 3B subunit 1